MCAQNYQNRAWFDRVIAKISDAAFSLAILYPRKKRPPFYFSNDCQKLTDFNDFLVRKILRKFDIYTCIL